MPSKDEETIIFTQVLDQIWRPLLTKEDLAVFDEVLKQNGLDIPKPDEESAKKYMLNDDCGLSFG